MAEGIQYAGDYFIEKLELITSAGVVVDLRSLYLGIILYEDLFSLTVTGTLTIQDSTNLASLGPIIGQEYLRLKIRTPFQNVEEDTTIDFSENAFIVHSIVRREDVGTGVQVIALSFVSQELIKNQRLKVMQSFTGSWSDIVEKIMTDPNILNSKKELNIESSAGIKKYVSPNIRPLDIIVHATKQAVAEFKSEPTYLFYETLKGFNFRTLANLYNEPSQLTYSSMTPGFSYNDGIVDIMKEIRTIINYNIVSNNDSIANYRTGMYGSTLYVHDIISKSYDKKVYNYHDNFKNEHHIVGGVNQGNQEFPIASEILVTEEGKRVSDFSGRTFVVPTSLSNGGADSQHQTENDTIPYMAYDPQRWLQRRNSQMIQLQNALNVNIEVFGNTLINVGDKVEINLPYTAAAESAEGEKVDKFYKGPFLIKTIRHDFSPVASPAKHKMYLSLVKDSLEEELSTDGPIEPAAKSTKVQSQEYLT